MSNDNNQPTETPIPKTLSPQEILARAREKNTGKRPWQVWKSVEAEDVVNLFDQVNQQALAKAGEDSGQQPRVQLLDLNFSGDLNLVYGVRMPVPLWPVDGKLQLGSSAVFHLQFREEWRWEAPAGWEPLGLFNPQGPFHPNMAPAMRGAICLGTLPPGVSLKELVLLGYYALSLQSAVLDESDPHGVLNPQACEYYRNHPEYLPLTHAGLADPWQPPAIEEEVGTIKV